MRENRSPFLSLMAEEQPQRGYENVQFVQGNALSVPITKLPSTTEENYETAQDGKLLYAGKGRTQAPRIPYSNGYVYNQQPFWSNTGIRGRVPRYQNAPSCGVVSLICHLCYTHGHTSPHCLLSIRELPVITANYKALTSEEKATVPMTLYLRPEM